MSDGHEVSSQALMARARQVLVASRYLTGVVLREGQGEYVTDVEGRRFIDFESGQVCMSLGHGHPGVREAMIAQIDRLMQIGSNFTSLEEIELAEQLKALAPHRDARVYTGSTGSESNEIALRIAKKASNRYEVIAVAGGYHGLTYGSASLTTHMPGSLVGYGPPMAGVTYVPTPYCYRCPLGLDYPRCGIACADAAREAIDLQTSGSPAAFIFEFVMSAGGVIVPPVEWFQRMREMCTELGAIMIADEAQTAMGRTGYWFASEHFGVVPEITTVSKSLGGGVALSAVIVEGRLAEEAVSRGYGQTSSHCGDPFPNAVGLANIRAIEREDLLARATRLGEVMQGRLRRLMDQVPLIGDVRGLGSIMGVEIVDPRVGSPGEPWPEAAATIFHEARRRGLLLSLRPTEADKRNVIRLIPPLIVSDDVLHDALDIMDGVCRQVAGALL